MDYRRVGDSGLVVSELSLGTATFAGKGEFFGAWGDTDVEQARRLIDLALEAGITLFDTADVYSDGASEEVLGEAMQGPARPGADFHQGHRRPDDWGTSRPPADRVRGRARCAGCGPTTSTCSSCTPSTRTRRSRRCCRRSTMLVAQGKVRYIGRLQLLRLAADEVAGASPTSTAGRATSRTRSTTRSSAATTSGS